jgi:hypothetical protein
MLLDLANLPDEGWPQFHRRYLGVYIPWPSNEDLVNWRLWLRQVWKGEDDRDVRFALAAWTREATRHDRQSWVFDASRTPYAVRPNYKILALSLAVGTSELLSKMAVCQNPGCPQPYFLRSRKTQRFCDRPACSTYGQREHKKNWWKEHGKEWKEKREGGKKTRGKHGKIKKASRGVLAERP